MRFIIFLFIKEITVCLYADEPKRENLTMQEAEGKAARKMSL